MKARIVSMMIIAALGTFGIANANADNCPDKAAKDASSCTKAKVASAKDGCCPKTKAEAVAAKDGCCPKTKAEAVAAKDGCCPKAKAKTVANKAACDPAKCDKPCDPAKCELAKNCDKKCDRKGKCIGDVLMATGMPVMHYHIGDKSTACPKQAKCIAKEHDDAKVRFVVDQREYCKKSDAMAAYAAALERYHDRITRVNYAVGDKCFACPNAASNYAKNADAPMRYVVGAHKFECSDKAEQAAQIAAKAARNVEYELVVDGKRYDGRKCAFKCASDKSKLPPIGCCAKGEAKTAKRPGEDIRVVSGDKCEYIVGETKTSCDLTARIAWAQARITAAHQAIAEMNGQEIAGR